VEKKKCSRQIGTAEGKSDEAIIWRKRRATMKGSIPSGVGGRGGRKRDEGPIGSKTQTRSGTQKYFFRTEKKLAEGVLRGGGGNGVRGWGKIKKRAKHSPTR